MDQPAVSETFAFAKRLLAADTDEYEVNTHNTGQIGNLQRIETTPRRAFDGQRG
jgi:hypothetical protein